MSPRQLQMLGLVLADRHDRGLINRMSARIGLDIAAARRRSIPAPPTWL